MNEYIYTSISITAATLAWAPYNCLVLNENKPKQWHLMHFNQNFFISEVYYDPLPLLKQNVQQNIQKSI